MTQYAGGKARLGTRIADEIVKYDLSINGVHEAPYFEPFVGMAGVMTKMCEKFKSNSTHGRQFFACDNDRSIVSFWRQVQEGWSPPVTMTKEFYLEIKRKKEYDALYAFAAYGCSFKGIKWGGFYKDAYEIGYKRLTKNNFAAMTKDVMFMDPCTYKDHTPVGMVVYCDPPYTSSKFWGKRDNLLNFDTEEFWETMRVWSEDNTVIISERTSPDDFVPIWSYTRMNGITQNSRVEEKLFVYSLCIPD